jgi:hypothetical protein
MRNTKTHVYKVLGQQVTGFLYFKQDVCFKVENNQALAWAAGRTLLVVRRWCERNHYTLEKVNEY